MDKKTMIDRWKENAKIVEQVYGGFVDWEEHFYICPNCDEPIYECDWEIWELREFICPICEWNEES